AEIQKEFAARRAVLQTTSERPPDSNQGNETPSSPSALDPRPLALSVLDNEEAGAKLRHSFAGHLGRLIEPAIAPLGFDWKMGIGIVSSFAAREVFVSTMSTVYNVGKTEKTESSMKSLAKTLQSQRKPD